MDALEKEQTIESIKTVIKARWLYISVIIAQGIILRMVFSSALAPSSLQIALVGTAILTVNFIFWFYLRRPAEKIKDAFLKIVKFSQVPLEEVGFFCIFYFSGTTNKIFIMMAAIPILVAVAIYQRKGIALATLSTMIIYTGLAVLEYFGFLPYISPEAAFQSPGKLFEGEFELVKHQLISFNMYLLGIAFYAGYIASLFRQREKRIAMQRNKLAEQTTELTQAKTWLKDALTKSDIARLEAIIIKEELEKANLELKEKIGELERFYNVSVGRELKMVELKKEIKGLQKTIEALESRSSKR